MEKLIINGNKQLSGDVTISGAKNAAVAILPATLLIKGTCILENVPNISDIKLYIEILESLGAKISWIEKNTLSIDTRIIESTESTIDLTRKFRASYYLIGSLLGRLRSAAVGLPGGCNLGARPIDQHIKGFESLGASITLKDGNIYATAENLTGNHIYLDVISVGATINIILASVLAKGTTIIENVAKEPHIVDVANFLNRMGANIKGAGTDTIKVHGVDELLGNATYSVVPDQIEAGTFMLAAMATKGDITIHNCISKHMESLSAKIVEMGGIIEDNDDSIRVRCTTRPKKVNIKTLPYPGFPTDLQSQVGVVLCLAEGTSIIDESIWDSRFQYMHELSKMGAKYTIQGKTAIIEGVEKLSAAPIVATDLRAGAALFVAACAADGVSELTNLHHIDRGYENFEEKFRNLGADIKRVNE